MNSETIENCDIIITHRLDLANIMYVTKNKPENPFQTMILQTKFFVIS